ncbi:MAG TPA: DUF3108 domain-containing protein [Burkholderiales bacterium]
MRSCFFLLISAVAAAPLAQAMPPARIEIAFEMTRNDTAMAETLERLEHADGRYELIETWTGKGVYALMGTIKRTSRGLISARGSRPLEFSDERTGRTPARAWFDWEAKTLAMEYKDPRRVEPLPLNAQDRLSFLLALSFLPGRAESTSFAVFDGRGQSRQEYRISGRERLKTPAGEFDTVVVERISGNDEARLWLAVELGHLPVRLLVVQKDGTRLEQTAIRITRP